MPKYNVGDQVQFTGPATNYNNLTEGKIYDLIEVDENDDIMPVRVLNDRGDSWWVNASDFIVVKRGVTVEELLAWKEAAIRRFPDLAKPETADGFVARLAEAYSHEGASTLQGAFYEAIEWGRNNPA